MKLPGKMGFQRGLAPFGGVQRQRLWQDSKGQRPLGRFGRQPNKKGVAKRRDRVYNKRKLVSGRGERPHRR